MITIKNTSVFKKSLEAISGIIQEANVRFKDDGIYIKAIDKTQIILVDFVMPKSCFESYVIEPNLIGLNLVELNNMVSRTFEKDKIKLELKENYLDIYHIGAIQRRFNLPFIDLNDEDIKLPEIKFDAQVKINAYLLKEILKDASIVSSTITFKVIDGNFVIESEGEKGKIQTEVSKAQMKSKKPLFVKFSLSFLKNITKTIDNDVEVLLKFSEEAPLYLEYNLDKDVNIKFYLSSMLL